MKAPIAVIGAGPAGITAAVQLKRFGVPFLLFEKNRPGGLLHNAFWVENYPGFPGGISGEELCARLRQGLAAWNIEPIHEEVVEADYREDSELFVIRTPHQSYLAGAAVLASGTIPRTLPAMERWSPEVLPSIFYEIRDIRDVRGNSVLIAGAGDAAFDYAIQLASAGRREIIIVNRGDKIRALPLLERKAKNFPQISCCERTEIDTVSRDADGCLTIKLREPAGTRFQKADILLVAVGRNPNNGFYGETLRRRLPKLVDQNRFYEVGDLTNGIFRQAVIAAGNGMDAAMRIRHFLFPD